MPKPYGFTATGQIEHFLKQHPDEWYSVRSLSDHWTPAQLRYAFDLFLANNWVERRISIHQTRRSYEYQWKVKQQEEAA